MLFHERARTERWMVALPLIITALCLTSFVSVCYVTRVFYFPFCTRPFTCVWEEYAVQTTIKARGTTFWSPRVFFFCPLFHPGRLVLSGRRYKLAPEQLDSYQPSFMFIYGDIRFDILFCWEEVFRCSHRVVLTSLLTVWTGRSAHHWFPGTVKAFQWLTVYIFFVDWPPMDYFVSLYWLLDVFQHFCPKDHWPVKCELNWAALRWVRI